MKIWMNVENVALTMSQPSQVSLRLGAILDTKRRRHLLRRATIVSALLLTAGAVPLLAAAQAKADKPPAQHPSKLREQVEAELRLTRYDFRTDGSKHPMQYRFWTNGKMRFVITSTSIPITVVGSISRLTGDKDSIDIGIPDGEVVFSAKSIHMSGRKFALNDNVVITVRDKTDKSKPLFQFKADNANLVGPSSLPPNSELSFYGKSIRAQRNQTVATGNAGINVRDKKDKKTLLQFKADSATMDIRPQNRR